MCTRFNLVFFFSSSRGFLFFFQESSLSVVLVKRIKICRYLTGSNALYVASAILFTLGFVAILSSWGVWITVQVGEGVMKPVKVLPQHRIGDTVFLALQHWSFINILLKKPTS